jgi:hypothetical protein
MTALLGTGDLAARFTFTNASIVFLIYVAYLVIHQIVYYRFFHPLAKFPGPFWASVTRVWVAYRNFKEDERFVEYDLIKKHGIYGLL